MVGIKGKSGRKKGYKHTEGTKKLIKENTKIALSDSEKRKKMSLEHLGKKHSEETIGKIRESCKNCLVIHHINGNHFDDRPKNRLIVTPREHARIHILQGDIYPYGKKEKYNA